jgi:hypothetical protein
MNPNRWRYTKYEWLHKYGIRLPTWNRLKEASWGFDDFRVLSENLEVLIDLEHKGKMYLYRYRFTREFITDLASVPKYFRSIIDNDDKQIIIAALVHDAEFGNQWHDFRSANTLLKEIAIYFGMPRWRAFLAWAAVSSPAGKRRWRMHRPDWEKAGVEFACFTDKPGVGK